MALGQNRRTTRGSHCSEQAGGQLCQGGQGTSSEDAGSEAPLCQAPAPALIPSPDTKQSYGFTDVKKENHSFILIALIINCWVKLTDASKLLRAD